MWAGTILGCIVPMLLLAPPEALVGQRHGTASVDPVTVSQLALVALAAAACSLLDHRRWPCRVQARLALRDVDAVQLIRDWAWARDARVQRLRARRWGVHAVVLGHRPADAGTGVGAWLWRFAGDLLGTLGRAVVLLGIPLVGGIAVASIWSGAADPVRAAWDHEGWVALAGFLVLVPTVTPAGAIRYTVALRGDHLTAIASRDAAEARETLAFLMRLCELRAARCRQAPRRGRTCHALTVFPPCAGWPPIRPRQHDPDEWAAYAEECRVWVGRLARAVAIDEVARGAAGTPVARATEPASLAERRLVALLRDAGLPVEVSIRVSQESRHPDRPVSHDQPAVALRALECLLLVDVECDGPGDQTAGRDEGDRVPNGRLINRGWYVAHVNLAEAERGWPAAVIDDLARLVAAHRAAYQIGSPTGQAHVRTPER